MVDGDVLEVGQEIFHGFGPGVPLHCLDSGGIDELGFDFVLPDRDFVGEVDLSGRGLFKVKVEELELD